MIIMKRMVFSLSIERTPYQCRYFYIGAWAALGTECCECWARGLSPLTCRTGWTGIDMRFANFPCSVSPRKHFLAGRLPGLHHIVERPHLNSTSRRGFYFN